MGPPQRLEPADLYWPLPPEQPRIQYLRSIYTEDDIGRVYSFMEKLFGKEYDDSLRRPYGVSVSDSRVYVSDLLRRGAYVFDLNERRMKILDPRNALGTPAAVVSDADGTCYVADAASDRISVYDRTGEYRTAFVIPDSKPVALAVNDSLRRLYVVDRLVHRVIVLDLDGKTITTFGGRGNVNGKFNIPLGIAIDHNNDVLVLDNGNFRVQRFNKDGRYLSKFGSAGDRAGRFANPKGIAVDSEGHIYVTDAAFSNFQIFDREGTVLLAVGGLGVEPGRLYLPAGIAIDGNDRIYIADQLNARIQVFQYLKQP